MTDEITQFKSQLSAWVENQALPGVQYAIFARGEKIDGQNLGHKDLESSSAVDDRTIFRLASASKLLVSVAFLRLVEMGKIALSDPLSQWFPEYAELRVLKDDGTTRRSSQPIRMIDLLRHSCGYGYGDGNRRNGHYRQALMTAGLLGVDNLGYDHWITSLSLRDWAARLATVPMEDEPGSTVSYGLGHDLAGAVIEAVSEQSLADFFAEQVSLPLGLDSTFFVVPESRSLDLTAFYDCREGKPELVEAAIESEFLHKPHSYSGGGGWDMLGNGGLVSNVTDLVRVFNMLVNDGVHDGKAILSHEHARQLCTAQSTPLLRPNMLAGCEYSYGVAAVVDPSAYREKGTGSDGPKGKMWWGGSTNTYFFYVPETKRIGVFLTNGFPFGHKGAVFKFGRLS